MLISTGPNFPYTFLQISVSFLG